MQDLNEANKALDKAKIMLFTVKGASFYTTLIYNLNFRWNEKIPTACTDGKNLLINPNFFLKLPKETRVTLLAHEILHVALLHMFRRGNRNPYIWNLAADHAINLMLEQSGYTFAGINVYKDTKYTGWPAENIYEDIQKNSSQDKAKVQLGNSFGSDLEEDSTDFDDEGNPTKLTPQQKQSREQEVTKNVVGAVQKAQQTGDAGNIPGEISDIIDKFLNPVLPWEILLQNFFNTLSNTDYTWTKPNRRYEDVYLPSESGYGLDHLMFFFDISGSVSDTMIKRFFSEVKYIHEMIQPELLTLVTFDTKIQNVYEIQKDDSFTAFKITGRGGTCLIPVKEMLDKYKPTASVIFTDLEVSPMQGPEPCPILWMICGNPKATVPYGETIYIEDN